MLAGVLTWLDASPAHFGAAAWAVFTLAAGAAAAALCPGSRGGWRNPALFAGLALLCIAAFRWPMLCDNRELMNPDESQMISSALTLDHSPLYWKSIDGQTRGPLDDWPLLAMLRMTGHADYTQARLLSVLLAWISIMCAWTAFRHLFTDAWAALLVLPLLALHAFTDFWDFVQYGSEHVAAALVAISSALILTAWRPPQGAPSPAKLCLAGLALGAIPFAKLQAVPIAAWIGLFGCWRIAAGERGVRRARSLALLVGGALAVPALLLLWVASNGIWNDFLQSYVQDNIWYAGARWFTWAQTPAKLYELCGMGPGTRPFLVATAALSAAALVAFPRFSPPNRRAAVFAAGLALASALAAMAPGRMFTHYLQLMFFPFGLLAGIAAGAAALSATRTPPEGAGALRFARPAVIGAFLALGLVPQVLWRAREAQASLGRFTETGGILQKTAVSNEVLRHARAGEAMGVWGWGARFWVETGLVQATRDGNSSRQIDDSPARGPYRDRYLSDLQRSLPPVFLDAVGPGSFDYHDRGESGHEAFYELLKFVRSNYREIGDMEGTRIYLRNDRSLGTRR